MNKKVTISHSGKQHSYQVAHALKKLGMLDRFFTSSYIRPGWLQNYFLRSGNTYWTRRFLHGLANGDVDANWRFEIREILYHKFFGQSQRTLDAVYQRDVEFDNYVAKKIPQRNSNIFWGFQGSCHASLHAAKKSSKVAICELATAHAPSAVKILKEEQELHPEWADSIDNVVFPEAYYRRICDEPHVADIVIAASSFTIKTLLDDHVRPEKIRLLPLGFELDRIPFMPKTVVTKRPIKLLYAGRITQRKGIKYLLEAMKEFDPAEVELHIIGNVHGSGSALKSYSGLVLRPAMQQYELFKEYSQYDAFVLPSVFEGFGLVVIEAMAAGLPVITTPHTIGQELIKQDNNGYLVPVRDVSAIIGAIRSLLTHDPEYRLKMRNNARETAIKYSWEAYAQRLQHLVKSIDGDENLVKI